MWNLQFEDVFFFFFFWHVECRVWYIQDVPVGTCDMSADIRRKKKKKKLSQSANINIVLYRDRWSWFGGSILLRVYIFTATTLR